MHKNKAILTICLVIFLDNVGAGMIIPLLPTLFMNSSIGLLGASSAAIKNFYFGLSYMLFPIMALISNPYLGYLSDYKGRKFVLIIGMVGFIITDLITILSIILHSLALFLLTRLILGFFAGSYTAASATLIDISSSEQEKLKNIKLITLISILGFIISPIFSVLVPEKLTALSLTIPFVIIFCLSVLNFILILLFFPKITHNIIKAKPPQTFKMIFTAFSFIFKTPTILRVGIIFFLFQLGYNFYFQTLALNLQQRHNFSISQIGLFFFIMGICYTGGMYVLQPLLQRLLKKNVVIISIVIAAVSTEIIGINELVNFSIQISQVYILWGFNIFFFMVIPIVSISIYNQFVGITKENQGLIMGAAGQINSSTMICSALLIGIHTFLGGYFLLITSGILLMVLILQLLTDRFMLNR